MRVKRKWQIRLGIVSKLCLDEFRKDNDYKRYSGFLDGLYQMGVSINKEDYEFANGFSRFLTDLDIDLKYQTFK